MQAAPRPPAWSRRCGSSRVPMPAWDEYPAPRRRPLGDIELAPRRHLDSAASEIDDGVAADDADGQVGIPDSRQIRDRTQSCSAGLDIDGEPVVRCRRSIVLENFKWRIAGNHHALDHSSGNMLLDPRTVHRRRQISAKAVSSADTGMRVPATPKAICGSAPAVIQASGHRDADIVRRTSIDATEIALFELDAFARRIDARTDGNAIDAICPPRPPMRQAKMIGSMTESPRAHAEQPGAALVGRRLKCSAHCELIAARLNLKRHDQAVPPVIPIEAEIRAIDVHIKLVVGRIDNRAGLRDQLALHQPAAVPSGEISARMLADKWNDRHRSCRC